MCSSFCDTRGNQFVIDGTLENERESYALLFSNASTFRAHHVSALSTNAGESSKPSSLSDTVMVTYIPLVSSLQGVTSTKDADALQLLLDHVRLRRQLEHPLLRSLFDVFYTSQCLVAPTAQEPLSTGLRKPVEANASASRAHRQAVDRSSSEAKDDGVGETKEARTSAERDDAGHAAVLPSTGATALVLVEDFVEGCTLAEYADAVTRRRLVPSSAKLQRDAAAIVYQLAQLLSYLHGTAHVLCRALPWENVHLDLNRGSLSVRLPLTAIKMLEDVEERNLSQAAAALACEASRMTTSAKGGGFLWQDDLRPLQAPELRDAAYWDAVHVSLTDPATFGAADVWFLGVITAALCLLHHKRLHQAGRLDRLRIIGSQIDQIADLLPSDTQEGMLHLIRSCLRGSPAERPCAAAVLRSTVFVTNRSHVELEQQRTVIGIAEAVANANKRKMPPASLQLAESATAAAANVHGLSRFASASADKELTRLSLHDTEWDIPQVYGSVFLADGAAVLPEVPASPQVKEALRNMAPSLARATADAFHDVERLSAQRASVFPTDANSGASRSAANAVLRDELRHSRQMPRDLSATARVFEELTERLARLEKRHPDAAFRLMELLLEGLSSSPQDVDAVRESVTLADALFRATPSRDGEMGGDEGGGENAQGPLEGAIEDSFLSVSSAEAEQKDFQVGDVLRAMPSMPSRMIASDRAANTSAVLYNQWLNKQKKKNVKFDAY